MAGPCCFLAEQDGGDLTGSGAGGAGVPGLWDHARCTAAYFGHLPPVTTV